MMCSKRKNIACWLSKRDPTEQNHVCLKLIFLTHKLRIYCLKRLKIIIKPDMCL